VIGVLLAAVTLLGVLIVGVLMMEQRSGPAALADAVPVGGPFHLVDQDGRAVDQHILDGHWSAVFFGYTYCPDTCPATLQALGAASRQIGDATPLQVVFITVDPARDTQTQMKLYLQSQGFPAHAIGLTGSPEQIAAVAKAYGVYYAKAGSGADYTMDHSAAVYLMDPKGRFARPLSHDMAPSLIAQQIKAAQQGL
jgi:protein SCO1/2